MKNLVILFVCLFNSLPARALNLGTETADFDTSLPAIAIIIDDLGDNYEKGLKTVQLPGPVACAFLPHTPHVRELAKLAHGNYKEVMLHLPMQSMEDQPLGPGAITLNMGKEEFLRTIEADIASVPHAIGINNHMGSLITRHPGHMLWLMQEINRRGNLFFVDSRTVDSSVAQQVANESGVPNLRRDVFLDSDRSPKAVARQFNRLLQQARHNGSALAIGHPYASTLSVLRERLPRLKEQGIQLVPVSYLVFSGYGRHVAALTPPAGEQKNSLAASVAR